MNSKHDERIIANLHKEKTWPLRLYNLAKAWQRLFRNSRGCQKKRLKLAARNENDQKRRFDQVKPY